MKINDFLNVLRTDLATLPGLDRVYVGVPESINQTPSIVVSQNTGGWYLDTHGSSTGYTFVGMHTIRIELHLARKDLEREMQLLEQFLGSLPLYIFRGFVSNEYEHTLIGVGDPRTAQNATLPVRYDTVSGQWGSDQHIGYQIDFDVAIQEEVPYE